MTSHYIWCRVKSQIFRFILMRLILFGCDGAYCRGYCKKLIGPVCQLPNIAASSYSKLIIGGSRHFIHLDQGVLLPCFKW